MVFRPREPKRYLFGLIRWQGLFLKRQKEVAADYAALISKQLLTPANMMQELFRGAFADRIGFDPIVQAESGFVSMNGYPDREGVRALSPAAP